MHSEQYSPVYRPPGHEIGHTPKKNRGDPPPVPVHFSVLPRGTFPDNSGTPAVRMPGKARLLPQTSRNPVQSIRLIHKCIFKGSLSRFQTGHCIFPVIILIKDELNLARHMAKPSAASIEGGST